MALVMLLNRVYDTKFHHEGYKGQTGREPLPYEHGGLTLGPS